MHGNQSSTVQFLLDEGVHFRSVGSEVSPFIAAAENGRVDLFKILLKHRAATSKADLKLELSQALLRAAMVGNLELVVFLMKQKVNLEVQDSTGRTALWIAASSGHTSIVSELAS